MVAMTQFEPKNVRNPVTTAMTSAFYGYMLQKESTVAKGNDTDSHHDIESEGDEGD